MTRRNLGWYGFLGVLALLPTALPGAFTNGFDVHVMILVLLYASMAQAWNLIGGYGGQVSFGHSVFFGLGAYGAAMASVTYHGSPWVGALVGSLGAAGAAVIISYPCFRLKGHYFAIATFAIVEIFNRLFMMWNWVGGALGLDYPLLEEGWKNFMWFDTKVPYYYGALGLFAVVFGVVRWVDGHRLGAWLRAVREGQEAAESLGVNSARVKLSALALSAFLAGLCGAFFAQYNYRVDPPMVMSLDMAMKFVLISILGGVGTFWGPLVGAAILMPLQEYTRAAWGGMGGGVDLIIFGVLIIFVVTRQPQGVVGLIAHVFRRKG